ncbi:hypothetical protein [Tautonia plasticadhaerens]|uniref:Uncharacterized protein n=1 Tax=Tautonia plasticadhaerens TaxID=2527974 RepID=A0A518H772_9BACT|nr:hypothetical protein [Tautonia plasticadhaerens]QDV36631.1 hypothetical protein ElP_45590 [Tautonia plasticadhaerens]
MPPLLWAEFSIQFLIPAIFLVIWALNQVFGRAEGAAAARPRERIGPRPIPPGPSRAPQQGSRPPSGPPGPRQAPASPNRQATARPARRGQGRPVETPPARPPSPPGQPTEPARRPRQTTAQMEEVYAIYEDDRVSPRAVDTPLPGPVSAAELRPTPRLSDEQVVPVVITGLDRLIGPGISPSRLREAILLGEIIGPPMATRGRRGTMTMPILPRTPQPPAPDQGEGG